MNEFKKSSILEDSLKNDPYFLSKLDELFQDDEHYYFYKHYGIDVNEEVFNVFTQCKFKFSHPANFNDPFDCCFNSKIDFSNFKREEHNKIHNYKLNKTDWKNRKEVIKEDLKRILIGETMAEFRKRHTITCFNNSPLNILMWSHYAKNHEGFMIEFKFKKDELERFPFAVKYTNEFPTIVLPWNKEEFVKDISLQLEALDKIFLHKSKDWSYENEFRMIAQNKEFLGFPPRWISTVILGTKIKLNHEHKMKQVIQDFNSIFNMDAKIFKTKIMKDRYELYVPNHPRLSANN